MQKKKHSLLVSRSPFDDVVNNFLSSFRVIMTRKLDNDKKTMMKAKQLTFFYY